MSDEILYDENPTKFETEFIDVTGLDNCPEHITAAFVFVIDGDKNLLALKNERGWDIPGGHTEEDESPEVTARREVLEESCVEIDSVEPFAIIKNGSTAMAVFMAEPKQILEFVPDEADPTSDRTFMALDKFMTLYSGGDKVTMSRLIEGLLAKLDLASS